MARFDRYLLAQLFATFGFFSLVLVGVYWINRTVGLFDQLIGDGQSALVFLEFSLLTLPNVIRVVLPISAFVAVVYVVNRLAQESELVVVQATGFSVFRLARPILVFGLSVSLMVAILANLLVPASRGILSVRTVEIAENVTAKFLNEGQFMHPAKGITLYIRTITANGELRDLFLADDRDPAARLVYTARRALLVRGAEVGAGDATGPKLLMFDGIAQELAVDGQRLAITRFADFTYDLAALIQGRSRGGRDLDALSTRELFGASDALLDETRSDRAAFLEAAHSRFVVPLLATVSALLGFAALMLGGFSRFGLWRQIGLGVVLLILVQGLNTAATSLALRDAGLWPVLYLPPALGLLVAAGLMAFASAPGRRRREAAA